MSAASEERLRTATEQIGIATADPFSRVSILRAFLSSTGFYRGYTTFDGISAVNLTALNIDWSFLDTGRVRARIAAKAGPMRDAQLAQYQQSVLLALEDVEDALVSYARSQDRDVQLQRAAKDSKLAADLCQCSFQEWSYWLIGFAGCAESATWKGRRCICRKPFQQRPLSRSALQIACRGVASTSSSTGEKRKPLRHRRERWS